jgi:hypothetical protein
VSQSKEKRRQRREMRLMQQEATWLQKAVFAFGKVEDIREKIADLNEQEPDPFTVELEGGEILLDDIAEALEERVQGTLEMLRERRGMVPRT